MFERLASAVQLRFPFGSNSKQNHVRQPQHRDLQSLIKRVHDAIQRFRRIRYIQTRLQLQTVNAVQQLESNVRSLVYDVASSVMPAFRLFAPNPSDPSIPSVPLTPPAPLSASNRSRSQTQAMQAPQASHASRTNQPSAPSSRAVSAQPSSYFPSPPTSPELESRPPPGTDRTPEEEEHIRDLEARHDSECAKLEKCLELLYKQLLELELACATHSVTIDLIDYSALSDSRNNSVSVGQNGVISPNSNNNYDQPMPSIRISPPSEASALPSSGRLSHRLSAPSPVPAPSLLHVTAPHPTRAVTPEGVKRELKRLSIRPESVGLSDKDYGPTKTAILQATRQAARSTQPPNTRALGMCLHYVDRYLTHVEKILKEAGDVAKTLQSRLTVPQLESLFIYRTKLEALFDILPLAQMMPSDDLLLDPNRQLLPCERRFRPGNVEKFNQDLDGFFRSIAVGASFVDNGVHYKNPFMRIWMMGVGAVYYGLNQDAAAARGELVNAHANLNVQKTLWNLPDSGIARGVYSIVLPSVNVNHAFEIPRPPPPVLTADQTNSELLAAISVVGSMDPLSAPPVPARLLSSRAVNEAILDALTCSASASVVLTHSHSNGDLPQDSPHRSVSGISTVSQTTPIPMDDGPSISSEKNSPRIQIDVAEETEAKLAAGVVHTLSSPDIDPTLRASSTGRQRRADVPGISLPAEGFVSKESATEVLTDRSIEKAEGQANLAPDNCIVLHIHGGGFIGMSSFSHQNYTRQWTNATGLPIVSIDYRLAPEHPFPAALYDCWHAYVWLCETGAQLLQFDPSRPVAARKPRIILVGDSAGGNLAAAVTIYAITSGYTHIPDALLLAYPALKLQANFSPSLLLSMDDRMVPYTFLLSCLDAYIGLDPDAGLQRPSSDDPDHKSASTDRQAVAPSVAANLAPNLDRHLSSVGPDLTTPVPAPDTMFSNRCVENPLISPCFVSDAVLKQFPVTHIVVGEKDPLHDECVRFANRMHNVGCEVSLTVYEHFPHGFLSFDFPFNMFSELRTDVKRAINETGAQLLDLALKASKKDM